MKPVCVTTILTVLRNLRNMLQVRQLGQNAMMDKGSTASLRLSEKDRVEDRPKKQSVVGLLKTFTQDTSMHGLGRVVSSRFIWLRFLWTVVVLAGASVAAYNVVKIVLTFRGYPVATVVSLEYSSSTPFPAISICNLNMVRKSFWEDSFYFAPLRENNFLHPDQTTPTAANVTDDLYYYDEDFFDAEAVEDETYKIELFVQNLNRNIRRLAGHQIEDMLLTCSYQNEACNSFNFTEFYNRKYGNCYTFNKKEAAKSVSKPGPSSGLFLRLNVEEEEYTSLTETVGFKLVVHPQDAMPFPEDEGIIISPGFDTSIAVSKLDIKRAAPPYGRCVNYGKTDPELNMYSKEYDVGYSDKACRVTCYQSSVYQACRCCDRDYPCLLTYPNGTFVGASSCNYSSSYDVECTNSIRRKFVNDTLPCIARCLPSCQETTYATEVSTGRWPSKPTESKFVAVMRKRLTDNNIDVSYVRQNLLSVEIYFRQLNYEQIETSPAYDWSRLLSDMGGQFGLWLGFSLLTALEIVQLLFDISLHVGQRLLCKKGKTKPDDGAISIADIN